MDFWPGWARQMSSERKPMLQERVTAIMDGKVTPLPSVPTLSSAGSMWSGFLFERHVVQTSRDEIGWSWHTTLVCVCTGGSSVIQVSGGAGEGRFLVEPGCVSIFPRGCDDTNIYHSGGGVEIAVVEVDTSRLERLFHEDGLTIEGMLAPQLYRPDRHILALIEAMREEVQADCPGGALYDESLSLALAAYVSSRYSAKLPTTETASPRLSPFQQRQVLEYLHAHLDRRFSLVEFAGVVHLSPRHFCRLFQNTLGTTPYQYVLNERIREAKLLLAAKRLSILEISETLGFASQSYFTDVFHKATGVSPRRYQRGY